MKNILRNWLGINSDVEAIAKDINMVYEQGQNNARQTYELFHAMPFAATSPTLSAQEAAALTQPHGVQANSLPAILMGVLLNARQGNSQMEVVGTLEENTHKALEARGFKIEEHEGTAGKGTFILWL